MPAPRCRVTGFSIIESVLVLFILSIFALWIFPSMSSALDGMRVRSTSETFLASMQLARNTAVIKSRHVVLCKSSDGRACQMDGGWEQGWIVFHDTNRNAMREEGEALVHVELPASPSRLRVRGNRPVESYISYTPLGVATLTSGAFQAGTVTICSASTAGRKIVLNSTGRARSEPMETTSCY